MNCCNFKMKLSFHRCSLGVVFASHKFCFFLSPIKQWSTNFAFMDIFYKKEQLTMAESSMIIMWINYS